MRSKMIGAAATMLAALAGSAVWAAAPAAAVPVWTVNKAASSIGFHSSFSGTAFDGAFKRWDARIAFDPSALDRSSVVCVVDLSSAATGDASRDESLPSPDWFNTAKFPKGTFTANKFRKLPDGRYEAAGTLTIKGVTRPVVLPFQLVVNGKQAQMKGQSTVNRSSFGVGQGQFAGADAVPFNVQVTVAVSAQRAP